ncbi:hypothetical protein QEJ31_06885 [Pigmentibacter sp. JX0631]|uniref:hypothetical protein n=1 Tax=Pigmentibacter sp. JX0631 TaxID=2976982 RepID=UPI002468DFDD|nr:hypothetical protein [Pigmentibacter sp. JX0631]WGL61317.1 hypothetical protein QEJ31_06885 [Pigmentibacter sp. JX0631]
MQNEEVGSFRRKGDLGIPFVFALFALSTIIGWIVFQNYEHSVKEITHSLTKIQNESTQLSLEGCADKTMEWFNKCDAMTQLCDSTVPRMIKVCLANSDKSLGCKKYGDEIYGYNFGAKQCTSYMHGSKMKRHKKACGDVWQVIAEYCKSAAKQTAVK